jgi:hypothetical protein
MGSLLPGSWGGESRGWLLVHHYRPFRICPNLSLRCRRLSCGGSARDAQVARLATFAGSSAAVPLYEQRMGYQQQMTVYEKRLQPSVP